MNRFFLLATAAVTLAGGVCSGAAFAASSGQNSAGGQQIVDGALTTVRQIEADSRYDALLKQAKGVFIMPELVKGAFIVGGRARKACCSSTKPTGPGASRPS